MTQSGSQVLLIDAGNSQVKSLRSEGRRLLPDTLQRHTHDDSAINAMVTEALDYVVIASVAAIDWEQQQQQWPAVPVHRMHSPAAHPLLKSAYAQPHTLGVDRWAAMLGARVSCPDQACCVADLGTATTLDAIDAEGQHLGGWILPGLGTSRDSLQRKGHLLAQPKIHAQEAQVKNPSTTSFANNTGDAIQLGTAQAQAAAILHFLAIMQAQGLDAPRLFLTGGWAQAVLGLLSYEAVLDPLLVFRGMLAQFEADTGIATV